MTSLVWGKGPAPCDIMIIGEAPGAEEDKKKEPFVGRSGKRLNEALEAAGLDREQIYITNVYKHRPPNNRKPTPDEILSHKDYLFQELVNVLPEHILLLGNTALETFNEGVGGVSRFRGVNLGESNFTMHVTYHPSATFRSKVYREAMFEDIMEFAKIARG